MYNPRVACRPPDADKAHLPSDSLALWCVRLQLSARLPRGYESMYLVTGVVGSEEDTPLHNAHQLLAVPHQLYVHSKLKLTKRERISYVANHSRA